ncbi:hypothetical protein [Sphingobium sp. CAP-1]|uniref:hypothetical protein n=1 Tax=Sphingobium sp. CAP-1 TaxID=2676077 RepID=UPI0012BB32D0|nr:hypothetical protein [Sphingobium sp. CAP-1]QGP78899.1 hypothetical protein GL174_07765 [Sphingobium sp. CAP-1]
MRRIAIAGGASLLCGLAVPGSAQAPAQPEIYDWLVMNVCVDAKGNITRSTPLQCPLSQQRDLRPDEAVPYAHADFPDAGKTSGCAKLGISRRYGYPLKQGGKDEADTQYRLVVGWTDYPPLKQPCGFGRFDARDMATIVAVGPKGASLVGAHHHGQWFLTLGAQAAQKGRRGTARFMDSWAFPAQIPPPGRGDWSNFTRKTLKSDTSAFSAQSLQADINARQLRPTLQLWKHIRFQYGSAARPSATLDTLLHIPFTSATEGGPGAARGSEHIYLTRELGYVTRWENWARDDAPRDVLGLAKRAYGSGNCSPPGAIEGTVAPNLRMGAVIDDKGAGVYKQQVTGKTAIDRTETHIWYMIGCHDFTNVQSTSPLIPENLVGEDIFGAAFMAQFR